MLYLLLIECKSSSLIGFKMAENGQGVSSKHESLQPFMYSEAVASVKGGAEYVGAGTGFFFFASFLQDHILMIFPSR